jgi:hypothetical protein
VAKAVAELDRQMEEEMAGCVKFSTLEAGSALAKIDSAMLSATKVQAGGLTDVDAYTHTLIHCTHALIHCTHYIPRWLRCC